MAEAALKNESLSEIVTLNAQAKHLFETNAVNEALELCKLSLKLADDYDANILLARILIKMGHRKQALTHLQTLNAKAFTHHLIDELIANIFIFYGDYEQAYAHLHKALASNPKLISPRLQLARIYYARKNYAEAEKHIELGLERGSKSAEIWGRYGRIKLALDKKAEAAKAFAKEEELGTSFISALNISHLALQEGDIDTFVSHKNKASARSLNIRYTPTENSTTLFVLLSPHSGNFILQKYPFEGDRLFINDATDTYYTASADYCVDVLKDIQKVRNYQKIVFIGTSKGGTGALIISALLSTLFPEVKIKTLAFSPQIFLWPFNANLQMPSYMQLYERIAGNALLKDNFERYGNVDQLLDKTSSHLDASIIYGTGFDMDRIEAENTTTAKVKKVPLNYSSHGTLMVYTLPPNTTKEALLKKNSALQSGDDDSAALSAVSTQWVDELFEIHRKQSPSLKALYES